MRRKEVRQHSKGRCRLGKARLLLAIVIGCAVGGATAQPPENDLCAAAIDIEDGLWSFTTDEAATDGPDDSACSSFGSTQTYNDIWYRYTAPLDGTLVISTCGTVDYDSRLVLYSDNCDELVEVACNDDGAGCPGYSSYLVANCEMGKQYLLRIGAYGSSQTGSGTFGIKAAESCDLVCESGFAQELEACGEDSNGGCNSGFVSLDQQSDPIDFDQPVCGTWFCDTEWRDTDWYSFEVAAPGGFARAELRSDDLVDGWVYFARDACPAEVFAYGSGGCPTVLQTDWLEPGSYRLIVAPGFDTVIECDSQGSDARYVVSVSVDSENAEIPANDDCEDAAPIGNGIFEFSTLLATTDGPANSPENCGDWSPIIGHDVWFLYTAECESAVTVSTCDTADFDTRLEIWSDGCDGSILACNDDGESCSNATSELQFDAICGEVYLIRVGGYLDRRGNGTLSVSCEEPCTCQADLNGDGTVGGPDLAIVLGAWGSDDDAPDFNDDGVVGGADLAVVLGAWGDC